MGMEKIITPELKDVPKINESVNTDNAVEMAPTEVCELAESYISLNNQKLKEGLPFLMEEVNRLPQSSSTQFLKAMIFLEKGEEAKEESETNIDKNKKEEKETSAEKKFSEAREILSELAEKEKEFKIIVREKDTDGKIKEKTFGNLSQTFAYMGDFYAKDYLKSKEKDMGARQKSEEFYKKAVGKESVSGLIHELKTIAVARKIINYFGNSEALSVWKTTRRRDLANETADMSFEHKTIRGKQKKLVDVTEKTTARKNLKNATTETSVINLPEKEIDYLWRADFIKLKNEIKKYRESGDRERLRTAERNFIDIFSQCGWLINKLIPAFDFKKISEKENFANDFILNKEKLNDILRSEDFEIMRNHISG